MNIRMRIAAMAIAGVGALGLGVGTAGTALAGTGPGTVTAVTHAADHPDTCACTTDILSGNGYVWAWDNLSVKFSVTPETSPGNYSVTITYSGSFSAFANPTTGAPMTGNGSVQGTIQYDVSSSSPPDPGNLPAQVPGDSTRDQAGISGATTTGQMLGLLFDGQSATNLIVGGGHYYFTYTLVDGTKDVQEG